jgi:hypothetical protein
MSIPHRIDRRRVVTSPEATQRATRHRAPAVAAVLAAALLVPASAEAAQRHPLGNDEARGAVIERADAIQGSPAQALNVQAVHFTLAGPVWRLGLRAALVPVELWAHDGSNATPVPGATLLVRERRTGQKIIRLATLIAPVAEQEEKI